MKNDAKQIQKGARNDAVALQVGYDNWSFQSQKGYKNDAVAVQLGAGNSSVQIQR